MKTVFRSFRIVDAFTDMAGDVVVEGGVITAVIPADRRADGGRAESGASIVLDGGGRLVLSSGFVDMHAHFREPGSSEKETLESASLAAARGGYTSVVCMANTKPVTDSGEAAAAVKRRADALGIVSLYPAVSLTEGMRGEKLSPYLEAEPPAGRYRPPLLSEDGCDVADDGLFAAALTRAAARGGLVSCHCSAGGEEAAVPRAVRLWTGAGIAGGLHIAHVSTESAVETLRRSKRALPHGAALTAEATPHHIALTDADAEAAGAETYGKAAPPLRRETDRRAVVGALRDGVIDVIATDHAPHTPDDKRGGAPGFSGLETAFAVCNTTLVNEGGFSQQKLFSLLSAAPSRLLRLDGAGSVAKGKNADIVILDTEREVVFDGGLSASRGKNTLFAGRKYRGAVLLTMRRGRIVHQSDF